MLTGCVCSKYNYQAANYSLIQNCTTPVHTTTNSYEPDRDILTIKENSTSSVVSSYSYITNNIGQRTKVTRGGTALSQANAIAWKYNIRGEVEEEDFGDNGVADARDRVFNFDAIGNRQEAVSGSLTLTGTANYTANALNQYTTVPSLPVAPVHDVDGNLTSGPLPVDPNSNATLTWDAENRLVKIVRTVSGNTETTSYEYDYQSRRIGKTVITTAETTSQSFIYEGWNLCAEYTGSTLEKTYTSGMDLSGSMQGAGGVGGLLMVTDHGLSLIHI